MVLLSYSYDTLVIGLALQSALADWWCWHWIPEPADSSIYNVTTGEESGEYREMPKEVIISNRSSLNAKHPQFLLHSSGSWKE